MLFPTITVSCSGTIRFSSVTVEKLSIDKTTRVVFAKDESDEWLLAITKEQKDSWKLFEAHGFQFKNKKLTQSILTTYNSRHKKYIKFIVKLAAVSTNGLTYHKLELINPDK